MAAKIILVCGLTSELTESEVQSGSEKRFCDRCQRAVWWHKPTEPEGVEERICTGCMQLMSGGVKARAVLTPEQVAMLRTKGVSEWEIGALRFAPLEFWQRLARGKGMGGGH